MKRLEFGETSKLADVLTAVSGETDKEIEIFVFPGSEILKPRANKEVIGSLAESLGKSVVFKGEEVAQGLKEAAGGKENLGFVEGRDVAERIERPAPETPTVEKKKRFSFPKIGFLKGPKWLYLVLGIVLVFIVGSTALFWLVPSAVVTLYAQAQSKEAELTLVASPTALSPDVDKGIIPLKTYEVDEEGLFEAKATGEKTVGTPAKGRVSIVNRDTNPEGKKFFAGTVLTPVSGLTIKFSLDQTATISASPSGCRDDQAPKCESTGADVTAQSIGTEGNLPVGTVFQVGSEKDLNKVNAVSVTNFSGGTSKKIKVVSADDQKKAKEELLKKLEEKANKDLKEKNPGIVIPEGGLESNVTDEVYSKKVDEEAEDFKLSVTVNFVAKTFSEEDLKDLLIKSIESSLPYGYQVDRGSSEVTTEILEKTGEDLKVLGKIKAALSPVVSTDEVRKNITGKNFAATDRYLKSLGALAGFEIKIKPSIFRLFGTMPHLASRIKIEVVKKE